MSEIAEALVTLDTEEAINLASMSPMLKPAIAANFINILINRDDCSVAMKLK